jgi:esterase/lipase
MGLRRWHRVSIAAAGLVFMGVLVAFVLVCKSQAHTLVTNPIATRRVPTTTPADFHMPYDEATVTTDDGLNLVGWWVPPANHSVVMIVPGYKGHRGQVLGVAEVLHRHGYGVLIVSLRGHDKSDGELLTFGVHEIGDLAAWDRYLQARTDVDLSRIGMMGISLGGQLAIRYAAEHRDIRALVADCAFSSVADTIETSVRHFTGLPAFPFAPMILFWAQREAGFRASDLDGPKWISWISPRPVLVMQGGADVVISPTSGQLLYNAARDPKEFWFEPSIGHAKFFGTMPAEYERRVVGFFDRYLTPR